MHGDVITTVKEGRDNQNTSSIVVVAEGGEQGDALEVAAKVAKELPDLDIRVSTLGHIQRGGSPTSYDRILSSRLGMAAVEGLVNGEKNVMVGVVNDKIAYTSFKLAISKAKPINPELMRLVDILSI